MDKPAIFFITLSLTASLLICVHTAPPPISSNKGTQSDANIQPNVVQVTAAPQTGTPNDNIHQNDNSLESGNEVDDEDNVSNDYISEGSVTANDNSVSVLRKSEEEDIMKSNDNVDVNDDDEDDEEDDDESSDEDDIVAGPGVKYHVINEDFGVIEGEEKRNGVKDPMSILDEDEGVLNRGLSDDVIIDALFTNIDTVQDQLEICEEGLRQKLLSSTPHMLVRREPVELDDETKDDVFDNNVKEPGQVFDDSSDEDSESDEDSKSVEDFDDGDDDDDDDDDDDVDDDDSDDVDDDYDYDSDSEDFDDSDEDDDDSEEEDMYKNTVRTRRSALSLSSQYVNAVSKTRPDPAVQVIMNRLSSRLEYLKKSLRQCYVLFKNMD